MTGNVYLLDGWAYQSPELMHPLPNNISTPIPVPSYGSAIVMDRLSSSRKAERRRHSSPYARPAETPRRQRRSTSPETPKSSIIQRARSFLSPLFRGTPSKHEDNDEEEDDEGETEGSGSEMEEDQDEEGSGQEEEGDEEEDASANGSANLYPTLPISQSHPRPASSTFTFRPPSEAPSHPSTPSRGSAAAAPSDSPNQILADFFASRGDKPMSAVEIEGVMSLMQKNAVDPVPGFVGTPVRTSSVPPMGSPAYYPLFTPERTFAPSTSGTTASASRVSSVRRPNYYGPTVASPYRGRQPLATTVTGSRSSPSRSPVAAVEKKDKYELTSAIAEPGTPVKEDEGKRGLEEVVAPAAKRRNFGESPEAKPLEKAATPDSVADTTTPPKKPRSQTASALLDILGEAESREPASNDTYVPPTDLSVFLNPYAKEGGATPKKTERKRAEEAAKSHTPKKAERSAIEVIERTAPKPAETEQKKEKSASPAPPNLHSFTPSKTTGTPVGTPSKFEYNKYKPVRSSKLSQGFSVPSPDPVEKVDNNKEEEKTEEVKEKPATPVISFDASAAKPAAAFSFGAPAAVAKKEEEKKEEPAPIAGFSFGAPKTAVPPPAPSFSFGVPAAKPAKEEEAALVTTATSSGFSFKQPTTVSDELNSSVDTSASLFAFKPSSDESAKTSATVSSATISSLVFSKTAEKDVKELAADTDVKGLSSYSFTVLPVADTTSAAAKKALVIPVSELQVYDFTKKAEVIQTQTHQATLSFDWAAAGMKMPQKAVDEWGCDVCLVTNKATADKCISCETPKPAQKTAANTHVSTPSFDWTAAGMKLPQRAADEWECGACMVTNKGDAGRCIALLTTAHVCERKQPAFKGIEQPASTNSTPDDNTYKMFAARRALYTVSARPVLHVAPRIAVATRSYADKQGAPTKSHPDATMPHITEETKAYERIYEKGKPTTDQSPVEDEGVTAQELIEGDAEAEKNAPEVVKENLNKFAVPEPLEKGKYDDIVQLFVGVIMKDGKKARAQNVLQKAFDVLKLKTGGNPLQAFAEAMERAAPLMSIRTSVKGTKKVQVPVPLNERQRHRHGIRWIIKHSESRKHKELHLRIADELLAVLDGTSNVFNDKFEVHRQCLLNRASASVRG
ncbi:hypothetical protein G7K_4717-t1 [Saitoella complicata NRRL Y-17804]|uniref:Nuclear pore complex protein Nup153 n=1 Tax=Saitoella complicata (strain BCRC 22490 / CBS 7301 / JCM 7358 / NBRC 10748 / NRRL Y-17804) TaxID=698492 RepID=A0A0E9NLB6_SAICN|nr:hypothetical protein G7K_4717-t1 [Saitoella complicata NRRL Y-17804]